MSTESKGTDRPWTAEWTEQRWAGRQQPVRRCLIGTRSPTGGRFIAVEINGPFHDGGEQAEANAALIVERVNGWDALVAERDRLREALLEYVERHEAASDVAPIGCPEYDAARAALEGGAA